MNHIYINIFEEKIKYYIDEFEINKRIKIKENEIIIPISFSTGERLSYIKNIISLLNSFYFLLYLFFLFVFIVCSFLFVFIISLFYSFYCLFHLFIIYYFVIFWYIIHISNKTTK